MPMNFVYFLCPMEIRQVQMLCPLHMHWIHGYYHHYLLKQLQSMDEFFPINPNCVVYLEKVQYDNRICSEVIQNNEEMEKGLV